MNMMRFFVPAILISLVSLPSRVLAHGEADSAPEMHPLLVGMEFVLLVVLGSWIADRLSRIGESPDTKER